MSHIELPVRQVAKRPRRWLRRVVVAFLVLIAISAALIFAADVWRRSVIEREQTRIAESVAQVDAEIQQGKSAAAYFRSRVKGTNGWKHVAPVFQSHVAAENFWRQHGGDDDVPKPWDVALDEAMEGLSGWNSDNQENPASDEQLATWLSQTTPLADAFAAAASCDTIVPVALDRDAHWPWYAGPSVFERGKPLGATFARYRLLRQAGSEAKARAELLAAAKCFSMYRGLYLSDVAIGLWSLERIVKWTHEQFIAGDVSAAAADGIAALSPLSDEVLIDGMCGEAVRLAYVVRFAPWATMAPTWFDWLRGAVPEGEEPFKMEFRGFKESFLGSWNMCIAIRRALEGNIEIARHMNGGNPWDTSNLRTPEYSLFGTSPAGPFRMRLDLRKVQHQVLALRLRLMEHAGPLREQRPAVEEAVARFPDITLRWDGATAVLGIRQELLDAAIHATAFEPTEPEYTQALKELAKALLEDDDGKPKYELRVAPIGELDSDGSD